MPLYEYLCEACAHHFEVIQKFSDPPVEVCPKCGGRVHKQLSSPAIQFKGSGWYITDYARKGAETSKSDGNKGADKPAEKAGEKSDSTPASGDAASTGDKAGSTTKSDSSSKT